MRCRPCKNEQIAAAQILPVKTAMTQGIITVLLDAFPGVPPAEMRENHSRLIANGNALPQSTIRPFGVLRGGHHRILLEQSYFPEDIERGTHVAARHRIKLKPRAILNG